MSKRTCADDENRISFHPLVLEWARQSLNKFEQQRKTKEAFLLLS